ncbi:MAG: hypothetical protein COA52_01415 [Hyphomicrobiales bacterium]|nr:MAG: hypothetical protein COA52_01415 [Hyphomicrobiales bacterium]
MGCDRYGKMFNRKRSILGYVRLHTTDASQDGRAAEFIKNRPDVIFHLASIVSGEAEVEFEKGYRINLGSTMNLLEAIRNEAATSPYKPCLVCCGFRRAFAGCHR